MKVDSSKILLTGEAKYLACHTANCPHTPNCVGCTVPYIAQCVGLIQELVRAEKIRHKEWRGLAMHGDYECAPDCWICKLLEDLTKEYPELLPERKK